MTLHIQKVEIRHEHDIVLARQRARSIADLLGFDNNDQTRVATAVSEIARNAFLYAGGGEVDFLVEERDRPQLFLARVKDRGPGIADLSAVLEGRYRSKTGMGLGITGAKRLMDYFHIESDAGRGVIVLLGKKIPARAKLITAPDAAAIADQLIRQTPRNPFEEMQQQNQELLRAKEEQPSLIFLDLMMPDMDGFETLARLKAAPETEHIPVIILTSRVLEDAERRGLNTRALAVLSKASTSREAAVAMILDAIRRLNDEGGRRSDEREEIYAENRKTDHPGGG